MLIVHLDSFVFVKCLLSSLACLKIELSFFFGWNSIYVMNLSPLLDRDIANIFP